MGAVAAAAEACAEEKESAAGLSGGRCSGWCGVFLAEAACGRERPSQVFPFLSDLIKRELVILVNILYLKSGLGHPALASSSIYVPKDEDSDPHSGLCVPAVPPLEDPEILLTAFCHWFFTLTYPLGRLELDADGESPMEMCLVRRLSMPAGWWCGPLDKMEEGPETSLSERNWTEAKIMCCIE